MSEQFRQDWQQLGQEAEQGFDEIITSFLPEEIKALPQQFQQLVQIMITQNQTLTQVLGQLAQSQEQLAMVLMAPKMKQGRAVKQSDGTYLMQSMETMQ